MTPYAFVGAWVAGLIVTLLLTSWHRAAWGRDDRFVFSLFWPGSVPFYFGYRIIMAVLAWGEDMASRDREGE